MAELIELDMDWEYFLGFVELWLIDEEEVSGGGTRDKAGNLVVKTTMNGVKIKSRYMRVVKGVSRERVKLECNEEAFMRLANLIRNEEGK